MDTIHSISNFKDWNVIFTPISKPFMLGDSKLWLSIEPALLN